MIQKSFFEKHHKRLVTEALIKAALCGLLVGFCANFLAALAAWIFDFGGVLFAVAVGVAVAVITGAVLYFVKFKPSVQDLAQRVDRLGLEERMITMLQLQQDESVIAKLQRENAKQHLKDVEDRKLRMRLPKLVTVLAVIAMVLGSGMTTVVALAANDILPPGSEVINPTDPMAQYLAISYMTEGGGEIEGETDQLLLPGEDATPVVAVAEDGWVFVGWDDGVKTTERQEKAVTSGALYTAIFEEISDEEGQTGEETEPGEGGNGNEGDQADDVPAGGANNAENAQGGPGEEGSGNGSDASNQGGQGEGQEEGEGKGDGKGQGAGGKFQENNQFIDGQQYYRDQLDYYYELAQDIFDENGEIPPELREFFETYFSGI